MIDPSSDARTLVQYDALSAPKTNIYTSPDVPAAYTSLELEMVWARSMLLENRLNTTSEAPNIADNLDTIASCYNNVGGCLSSMPSVDTLYSNAVLRCIMAQNMLSHRVEAEQLVNIFNSVAELRPSLTAQCHVLIALISTAEPANHITQIKECITFITAHRMKAVADKSQVSEYFDLLLISEAFLALLQQWDQPWMKELSKELAQFRVPLVLVQGLTHILDQQQEKGAWGVTFTRRETSFAILSLARLSSLPWVPFLQERIEKAIQAGKNFLNNTTPSPRDPAAGRSLEIERAFTTEALKTKSPAVELGTSLKELYPTLQADTDDYSKVYSSLPCCSKVSPEIMKGYVVEALIYAAYLRYAGSDIFDRRNTDTAQTFDDKYFDLVSVMTIVANKISGLKLRPDVVSNLLIRVMNNYEGDDFLEHAIDTTRPNWYPEAINLIEEAFNAFDSGVPASGTPPVKGTNEHIVEKLRRYLDYHFQHPQVKALRPQQQSSLRHEIKTWFKAAVRQTYDSQVYYNHIKNGTQDDLTRGCLHSWLYMNGTLHMEIFPLGMTCYSFIAEQYKPVEPRTPYVTYLFRKGLASIATTARLVNDVVSLKRDRKEENLNCLDFPEFGLAQGDQYNEEAMQFSKAEIRKMFDFEQLAWHRGLDSLRDAGCKEASAEIVVLKWLKVMEVVHEELYDVKQKDELE